MNRVISIMLWLGMALVLNLPVCSQHLPSRLSIKGVVRDSSNKALIPYAHLSFISGGDTVWLTSETWGTFTLNRPLKEPLLVRATAIGYKPYSKLHTPSKSGFNLNILMQQDTIQMAEVIVVGKMVAVVMRGDTIQYNAGAFKTMEGDYLGKMLQKMPGISLKNGQLTFNNEPIVRILVDGQNMFGSNSNALGNLKSSDVKRIDVYDQAKKSDQELGMKHPRKEKVMDITTRSKSKLHQKINLLFGLGREFPRPELSQYPLLYRFEGTYNQFTSQQQLTSFLKINNLPPADVHMNQQARSINGSLNYSTNHSGLKFSTQNSFQHHESFSRTSSFQEYYPSKEVGVRTRENQDTKESKRISFQTRNSFSYNGLKGNLMYGYNNHKREQQEIDAITLDGEHLSQSEVLNDRRQENSWINASLQYSRHLKSDLTFSSTISSDFTFGKESGIRIDTISERLSSLWVDHSGDEYTNRTLGRIGLSGKLSSVFLFTTEIESEYFIQKSQIDALNRLTGDIDTASMRDYNNRYLKNSGKLSISFLQELYSISLNVRFIQYTSWMKNQYPMYVDAKKVDYKVVPDLTFSYKPQSTVNGSLYYRIDYASFLDKSFFLQSLAVLNTQNPLTLTAGNANLKVPVTHKVELRYSVMNVERLMSLSFWGHATITQNYVTNTSRFFETDTYLPEYKYTALKGATLSSAVNGGTYYFLQSSIGLDKMLEGLGGSKVDVRLKYNYTHAPYYLQDQLQSQNKQVAGVDFNFISNFSGNVEIVLNSNSSMHWSESGLRKNRYFEEMAELTLRTDIIPKIRFTSVVNYSYKHSYDIQNEEPTTIFLRASLSRELGEKGEISLDGYNLLNVKNSNSLSLNPEYLIYRSRYSPGRYFLLTYALKIK